jgi:ribonucleoside-diphosphate reductase alpha subunit
MKVTKRSGENVTMKFDKVTARISNLTHGLSENVSPDKIAQQVVSSMYDGILTQEIDTLAAEVAIGMITTDPDYEILATRIVASNIQKNAPKKYSEAMKILLQANIITENVFSIAEKLDDKIVSERDNEFGYFGLKTLEKAYLTRVDNKIIETPQYMYMRVSSGIHGDDIEKILETYEHMSQGFFIHATPTLFNSGTLRPQMSSCFLISSKGDSIDGIYDTVKECAQISKWAGGIGVHVSDVRAKNSHIKGTNGSSSGIIPMLRVYNATARHVDQAGRRKGSIAVYLEPWHSDIMDFLELRLNQGDEEARCRDLFTALWIPDLFMRRVEEDREWSLFCPNVAKGLNEVYGEEFDKLYEKYESEGLAIQTVSAMQIWKAIIKSQTETGTPYMLYKDACNKRSNQKNIGVIKSSNLCTEILEVSNSRETAVCNLASVALPKFVIRETKQFDFKRLHDVIKIMTKNLNKVIDNNFYPVETAKESNMKHRPIGLGVQGLADVFNLCGMSFDSMAAKALNSYIFETIYHAALEASCELAEVDGPYSSFEGSPTSEGILQFDMCEGSAPFSGMYDWSSMKERVKKGIRNSLLVAPMPTASTAQILGNNECFEPYTTNIYLRRTLAGEFVVVNKHLVYALKERGLWSKDMKDLMVRAGGSIQNITDIPDDIKMLYKTVWEISQKVIIDMARDRGFFVDQSQSMNLFLESPTVAKVSSMHFYAWKSGLKTGMYYLRSKAKARPIQFSLEPECASCSG